VVAVRSLSPDDNLGSTSGSIQGVGQGPGGSGTDLGSVAVGDDVSEIGDVAWVGGPDTISSSQGEGATEIVLGAHATRGRGSFLEPELELVAGIVGEGAGKGDSQGG
jgi:hypothetical protein